MGDAMNYVASKMNATAADTSSVVARMGALGRTAGLSEKSIVGPCRRNSVDLGK